MVPSTRVGCVLENRSVAYRMLRQMYNESAIRSSKLPTSSTNSRQEEKLINDDNPSTHSDHQSRFTIDASSVA